MQRKQITMKVIRSFGRRQSSSAHAHSKVKSTHAQLNTGLDRDGNVQLRWRGGETSNLKERTSRQTKCNEREKLYVFCRRFPCHRSPILLTRKRVHRVNAPAPVPALRAAAAAHLVRLQVVSGHFI